MKIIKPLLLATIFISLGILWIFPQYIFLLSIDLQGFKNIHSIYSDTEISPKIIMENKKIAEKRIQDFWGSKKGNAKIILCKNPQNYTKFCNDDGAGCTIGTPFGTWIILNNEFNEDVLAHEMCHDELQERLGYFTSKFEVPTWFDEGLALQLDHRFFKDSDSTKIVKAFSQKLSYFKGIDLPKINELKTNKAFFGKGPEETQLAYLIAGKRVAEILQHHDKKDYLMELQNTKDIKTFIESSK